MPDFRDYDVAEYQRRENDRLARRALPVILYVIAAAVLCLGITAIGVAWWMG